MRKAILAATCLVFVSGISAAPVLAAQTGQSVKTATDPMNAQDKMMKKKKMKKGMQPDASGQGGSGPGSDQGGTKVAPK